MLLSKSTSFITHKYINNTTIFNKPSERIYHNYIYPRLFGTRLIGMRPTETHLIGTLKIDRVQLERVSLACNRGWVVTVELGQANEGPSFESW